jgi:hypothetical protein
MASWFSLGSRKKEIEAAQRQIDDDLRDYAARSLNNPDGYFAHAVDKNGALDAFQRWIASLSFAPGDLKKLADIGQIVESYVPFWLISAMSYSGFQGERGEDYKEKEVYTDAEGNEKTREVTKTRWHPVSGEVDKQFENMPICGYPALPAAHMVMLAPPKEHRDLRIWSEADIGNKALIATIDAGTAFVEARKLMDAEIHKLTEAQISGLKKRIGSVETKYVDVKVRQILMPAWQANYTYKGKKYDVLIHGLSGAVTGDRPYAAGKIVMLVGGILVAVGVIAAAVWFFALR